MIQTASQQAPAPFQSASLYVGDIAPEVNEAKLFEIFNAVGPVASIRVCRDAVTRRSLGYAYVNFHNVADAERVVDTMNYQSIGDRPCRIMWSQRDPSLRKSGLGNIFVKNLASTVDNKALHDTFSIFGNILSCKVASDEHGNSKGYGYVHFETQEAGDEAINMLNGKIIEGSEVFVGPFVRRQDRMAHNEWTNLYVKHFPRQWDEAKLQDLFRPFGEITSSRIMRDPAAEDGSEASRGFGFVNFVDHTAAMAACESMNGHEFQEDGIQYTLYVNRAQKRTERIRDIDRRRLQVKQERLNKFQGMNLYVKNLDDALSDEDLRDLFSPFGTITSACVMKSEDGHSRGFGFVCYSSQEEAARALSEMAGKLVRNKPITVTLHQRKEQRHAHFQAMFGGRMGPMSRFPMATQGMYAPMYLSQPMQPRPNFHMLPPTAMRGPQGRGGYPIPPYVTGGAPFQRSRMPGGRGGRTRPPAGAPMGRGQPNPNRNFKYTEQARNQPARGIPVPAQVVHQPAVPGIAEPVDPSQLAHADPQTQKNMIGERLYPMIARINTTQAPKITGMLLEMDNSELLVLLEDQEALHAKVDEALNVLKQHQASAGAPGH